MKEIFRFLKDLATNNNRVWFNENKDRYLEVKSKIERLTQQLINGVADFDPQAAKLRPQDCLYRIYRDTRFSPDKTPYKTHIGIYINPAGGKKAPDGGYYMHIEPGNSLVAGGIWCPDSKLLKALRQDIYDNVDEYLEIINNPAFAKYFTEIGDDRLKTAPKGFPKDWEYIELLRPRSFTAFSPMSDMEMMSTSLPAEVLKRMELLQPFNRFLNYTIHADE